MLALLTDPNAWAALLTLTALKIVLGIDNVVFISILAAGLGRGRTPPRAAVGSSLAFVFRVALLFGLSFIRRLRPAIVVSYGNRDQVARHYLVGGGLFLIAKATFEIHGEVDVEEPEADAKEESSARSNLLVVIVQLTVIDLVFSIDSIMTAVGLAQDLEVMVAAVVIAMMVMFVA